MPLVNAHNGNRHSRRILFLALLSAFLFLQSAAAAEASSLTDLYNRAYKLQSQGQYAQAEQLAVQVAKAVERKHGRAHQSWGSTLELFARIRAGQGRYAEAEQYFKQALAIWLRRPGPRSRLAAVGHNALGEFYRKQGRYKEAISQYQNAIRKYRRLQGRNGIDVAASEGNLGLAYQALGRLQESEKLLLRSLRILKKGGSKTTHYVANTHNNLGVLYYDMSRFQDAETHYRQAYGLYRRVYGANHPIIASIYNNLANVVERLGRSQEAIALLKQSLSIREKLFGSKHPDYALTLLGLAAIDNSAGRYRAAMENYTRALSIYLAVYPPTHPRIATTMHNLGAVNYHLGDYEQSEKFFRGAIQIKERKFGSDHATVALGLRSLANVYKAQRRYEDALPLLRRAHKIYTSRDLNHVRTAEFLHDYGNFLSDYGRTDQALKIYRSARQIGEKILGRDHPDVIRTVTNIAKVHFKLGQLDETEATLKYVVQTLEKRFGSEHIELATPNNNLGILYRTQKRFDDAERHLKHALKLRLAAFGRDHRKVASTLESLGVLYKDQGHLDMAYDQFKQQIDILKRLRTRAGSADDRAADGLAVQDRPVFHELVDIGWSLSEQDADRRELLAEAFDAAQWSERSTASRALNQMATRFAGGTSQLARLIRTRQDLVVERQAVDKSLIKALGVPAKKRDAALIERLRARHADTDRAIKVNDARIAAKFPEFEELSDPKPLSGKALQDLLGPKEAMLLYMAGEERVHLWAVTREAITWKKIDQSHADLQREITALRKSLDPVASLSSSGRGFTREEVCRGLSRQDQPCEAYDTDLGRAHRLYRTLMAPVESVIAGKTHLMVVPSRALTGLPFHMLVTAEPPSAGTLDERFRQAEWLIRRHAVTILPSVSSLRALRVFARKGGAGQAFIGIGDPVFRKPVSGQTPTVADPAASGTRGFAAYFRGRLADVDALSGAIPPLPDTADELRAVGKVLNAREGDIILGRRANEAVLKQFSANGRLADHRIVHFATHGLIAGEIKGLAEPALALSLPAKATETDDGLLTASEIAQLKLNADWVVLSACNTAAGDKPGAEALSGLARAFFYSGTRALLVSHWPVVSEAAVQLTTRTFASLSADPTIGRAEALRRSMLSLIDEGKPYQRHPSYWAPFIVVGEGAAKSG